jgi:DNA polymerase-3 subunit gamma/tau
MVLVRIAYAADLPTPDEVIRRSLDEGARGNGAPAAAPATRSEPPARAPLSSRPEPRGAPRAALASAPAQAPLNEPRSAEAGATVRAVASFEDLVALAVEKRDLGMKSALERDVRLVRFEDGKLEIALEESAPKILVGELSRKLANWTGRRWMVAVSAEPGAPSLRAQAQTRQAELKDGVRADPLVQAVLAKFPGAEIVDVRPPAGAAAAQVEEIPAQSDGDSADEEL